MTLRDMIEEKYGTIYKFIKETKLPQSFVYDLVRGTANPSTKKIEELADHLGRNPEEIFNVIRSNRRRDDGLESEERQD